jgi:hypothetical protein
MSTARFRPRLFSPRSLLLLWLTVILPLAMSPQQSPSATVSITIDPPETTLHVGQRQKFSAVVRGSHNARVEWAVQEQEGGSITEEGVYTAPRIIGIYHVIAVATTEGTALARAIAKVTVVTEYDSSPLPVAAMSVHRCWPFRSEARASKRNLFDSMKRRANIPKGKREGAPGACAQGGA